MLQSQNHSHSALGWWTSTRIKSGLTLLWSSQDQAWHSHCLCSDSSSGAKSTPPLPLEICHFLVALLLKGPLLAHRVYFAAPHGSQPAALQMCAFGSQIRRGWMHQLIKQQIFFLLSTYCVPNEKIKTLALTWEQLSGHVILMGGSAPSNMYRRFGTSKLAFPKLIQEVRTGGKARAELD